MMPDPALPRRALVTGAASGIGAGIVRRLLHEGWQIYALDHDAGKLSVFAKSAETATQSRLMALVADASSETDVAAVAQRIASDGESLDGLVCNAGIMIRKPLAELSLAGWDRVVSTNLTSTFLLAKALRTQLAASHDQGAIVTIASTRAHMSEPDTEAYAATKGGLVALTHALAVSFGPRIRVNCVSPGWIDVASASLSAEDHAQHPVGRVGQVADIAEAVLWLLRPETGFVTGAEFIIDGGMTRKMIYAE